MSTPSAVAHQTFELAACGVVAQQRVATRAVSYPGDVVAFACNAFGEFDVFAPLLKVSQRGAIFAGFARAVRVHRRAEAVTSSTGFFMLSVVT